MDELSYMVQMLQYQLSATLEGGDRHRPNMDLSKVRTDPLPLPDVLGGVGVGLRGSFSGFTIGHGGRLRG